MLLEGLGWIFAEALAERIAWCRSRVNGDEHRREGVIPRKQDYDLEPRSLPGVLVLRTED